VNDLISGRTFVIAFENVETAVLAVPVDRLFEVANADSGVKKFDHKRELSLEGPFAKRERKDWEMAGCWKTQSE